MNNISKQYNATFMVAFSPQLFNEYNNIIKKDKLSPIFEMLKKNKICFTDIKKKIYLNHISGKVNYYTSKNAEHWSNKANIDISTEINKELMATCTQLRF